MICPNCQKEIADNSNFCYLCGAQMAAPTQPAATAGPRRLARSATDKKLGGVCGGFAEYFGLDASIVRVVTVLLALFTGIGFIGYFVAWLVMPLGTQAAVPSPPTRRLRRSVSDRKIAGVCSGVAHYLDIDPTVVRIVWLLLVLFAGTGVLAYLVLWLVLPLDESEASGFSAPAATSSR